MHGLRAGKVDNAPSSSACRQAKVHILIIEEKTLVETAELFPRRAPDHQAGTHDLIDAPSVAMVPFLQEMRRHKRRPDSVQEHAPQQQRSNRRRTCAAGLNRALRVEQLNANNSYLEIRRL